MSRMIEVFSDGPIRAVIGQDGGSLVYRDTTPVEEPLKPCPFCGGGPIHEKSLRDGCREDEPDAWAWYVRCRSCAAQGPWFKTPGNAVRFWNQRVEEKR